MTKQDEILAEVEKARNLIRLAKRLISSRYCEHRYDPDQPRAPAGNPAGGRWTSDANDGAQSLRWMIAARGRSRAFCDNQYRQDIFQCMMVGLRSCYAQAMVRLVACERGDPIPPLNY